MSIPTGDDSDWADLASELGLETKPAPKPFNSAVPAGFHDQQTPGEPLPFPAEPWPQDPTAGLSIESSGFVDGLTDIPDDGDHSEESDTLLDPVLSSEAFASDDAEGESESDGTAGSGKKRRRRRRRRKTGPGGEGSTDGEAVEGFETDPEAEVEPVVPLNDVRTTADAIRDLVRNWSVPNWNDVVAGLYRPGGGDR